MSLPSLSDYQAAFSNPATCLYDASLKGCTIAMTPLGQPRVRSGGFALTYCLESRASKWAVRCFHKESTTSDRDRRYQAIAEKLREPNVAASGYFIGFDFQRQGVMVGGQTYPIVKMAWAKGETLASFLEDNHGNAAALGNLRNALRDLRKFLFSQHIAHGDIQPGNLMISDGGRKVQLIDYDGMYVPAIAGIGASEIGLPNYQHPGRMQTSPWSEKLDYFPFILLDLALTILIDDAACWDLTQSSDEKILFDATDFRAPYASSAINSLIGRAKHARELRAFQAICTASFDCIPHPDAYESFAPTASRPAPVAPKTVTIVYNGLFPVVKGTDMSALRRHCGNQVEIVGKIVEVKRNFTRSGRKRPYYFLSFERWHRGMRESFRFVIWSETLVKFENKGIDLNSKFMGKWVSMTALLDKYVNQYGTAYQMTVDGVGSFQCISEDEARFRCGGKRSVVQNVDMSLPGRNGDFATSRTNKAKLVSLTGKGSVKAPKMPSAPKTTASPRPPSRSVGTQGGSNAARLQAMLNKSGSTTPVSSKPLALPKASTTSATRTSSSTASGTKTISSSGSDSSGCLCIVIVVLIIGVLVKCCGG